jgi:hypothetical protein
VPLPCAPDHCVGIVALKTRFPFWKMLMVAGPKVGVMSSGQFAPLVQTFVKVICPPLGWIGADCPLACPGGLFPPRFVQENPAVTCTTVGAVPSPATLPEQQSWLPDTVQLGVPTKCGRAANATPEAVRRIVRANVVNEARRIFLPLLHGLRLEIEEEAVRALAMARDDSTDMNGPGPIP